MIFERKGMRASQLQILVIFWEILAFTERVCACLGELVQMQALTSDVFMVKGGREISHIGLISGRECHNFRPLHVS